MKRILITGKDSYIGTSFEKWMEQHIDKNFDIPQSDEYVIDTVDTRNEEWKNMNFDRYDVVFHVAGIAHVDTGGSVFKSVKRKKDERALYYEINRDLTIEVAKKAKDEGVKQFIFMSSIIVYGEHYTIREPQTITKDTKPKPTNYYGMSKLLAERGILSLQSNDFNVVILRPPMIYGKGCKGNYPKLAKLARISPVFPDIENKRSMLFIDNLCEFVRLMIVNEERGVFFPQNSEYVVTSQLTMEIASLYGNNIILTQNLNKLLYCTSKYLQNINKLFGSLTYDKKLSHYNNKYQMYNTKESIRKTEMLNLPRFKE